jgi:2-phospho-L-lactate guanylyltransferase
MTPMLRWCALVPQKSLAVAKGRLELEPGPRRALAAAMLRDTVAAITATDGVEHVLLLFDDPADAASFVAWDSVVTTSTDLNGSVLLGAAAARRRLPAHGIVVVPGDLPALRPAELDLCLEVAAGHSLGYVPDADKAGTTILTATGSHPLTPAYGPGSSATHASRGVQPLALDGTDSVRTDVDDLRSLAAALALGCGEHTRACCHSLALTPQEIR